MCASVCLCACVCNSSLATTALLLSYTLTVPYQMVPWYSSTRWYVRTNTTCPLKYVACWRVVNFFYLGIIPVHVYSAVGNNTTTGTRVRTRVPGTTGINTTRVPWYTCTMVEYTCTMVPSGTCVVPWYVPYHMVPWYVYVHVYHGTRVPGYVSQASKCPARTTTRGTRRRGLPLRPF